MKKIKFYLYLGGMFFMSLALPTLAVQAPISANTVISNENIENPQDELQWVEKECEVTMYTLAECGKSPKNPWYGITSSGTTASEGRTVAASPEIPFDSKIMIEGLNSENAFKVEDRGGMIKTKRGKWPGIEKVDVYTTSKAKAVEWGRRRVKCKISYNYQES